MSRSRARWLWLGALVVALSLTGWSVSGAIQDALGPQVVDLAGVTMGEWRPVNVGKASAPVMADYRVVSVETHPSLLPRGSSSGAERKAPTAGIFAVVTSECRCPISEDLRPPRLRVIDDASREWTSDGVSQKESAEFGDGARAQDIGEASEADDAHGRVGDVQRLVEVFTVAQDAQGLEVVVDGVQLGADPTREWVRWR
ncbi:MAG TPA: hypothetical protein PK868_04920 [Phycicoccus sp.]|nr:hypothetical protein [Phycicoccus sp.]HQH07607.1 hypothetical protein [Phycicoccus sp.]